jgi:segregation and condensation protein B
MSLKAKLEAVIYAAEEPVTLAQLAALFGPEALEWKAEREAVSANGETEAETEAVPLLNAEIAEGRMEQPSATALPEDRAPEATPRASAPLPSPRPIPEASVESGFEVEREPGAQEQGAPAGSEDGVEDKTGAAIETAPDPVDSEAEAKRLARQRDREVRAVLRGLLDEVMAAYASDDRGIEIKEIAGGYRMATKPECHDAARAFVKSLKPALKLSLPALETLAVIAYKQPVTAPEVNEIRGVESSGVFGSLLARKLIATAGRKPVIGRPILYKTTREFLLRFGLKDVTELPSMEEFEKMAQLEFEEVEPEASSAEALEDKVPEVDDDPDEPTDDGGAQAMEESSQQQAEETAARADSQDAPAHEQPEHPEPAAEASAAHAERSAAEDAPAAPFPGAEQAETETVPHD